MSLNRHAGTAGWGVIPEGEFRSVARGVAAPGSNGVTLGSSRQVGIQPAPLSAAKGTQYARSRKRELSVIHEIDRNLNNIAHHRAMCNISIDSELFPTLSLSRSHAQHIGADAIDLSHLQSGIEYIQYGPEEYHANNFIAGRAVNGVINQLSIIAEIR